MARIRTIKPEFWTSEQVVECSPTARLLFVGMWNFADDAGRMPASLMRLKMQVFPGDAFSKDAMSELMDELIDSGLVDQYEAQGQLYWQVTGWHHQKIDRPNIKYPGNEPSSNGRRAIVERSSNDRRGLVDDSLSDHRQVVEVSPPEGKGREGKGKEEEQETTSLGAPSPDGAPQSEGVVDFVFPTQSGTWAMPPKKLVEYTATFAWPVEPELRKAALWLRENKRRRPRDGPGISRFLTRWLNRADENRSNAPDKFDEEAWIDGLDLGEE